jgi:hypothetical protein
MRGPVSFLGALGSWGRPGLAQGPKILLVGQDNQGLHALRPPLVVLPLRYPKHVQVIGKSVVSGRPLGLVVGVAGSPAASARAPPSRIGFVLLSAVLEYKSGQCR